MGNIIQRFRVVPYLIIGAGLLLIGLLSLNHVANNFWPIDVTSLNLVRATAQDQADATQLLQASNPEIILAFLTGVMVAVTGLTLPLAYYLNKRFGRSSSHHFLIVLRQAMWVGLWVAFCTWLQMNRTLGWGIALLVGAVLIVFEIFLQVRTHATGIADSAA